jgi:hypothetical protein
MRSKRWTFVLVALVAVFTLVGAGTVLAAGSRVAPACVTYVSPPPPPHGSHLVMNVRFMDLNGEDSGNVGYWAFLPATREHVLVWQIPDGSFYSIETMRGPWITYPGVPSSNCDPTTGLPVEQASGSGTAHGWVTWTLTGKLIPGLDRFGWKPPVDEGGSPADVQLGWYGTPPGPVQVGNTGPWWFWYTNYFLDANGNPLAASATPNWGPGWEVYRYKCQTMTYNTAVSGTIGNIVVTK